MVFQGLAVLFKPILALHIINFQVVEIIEGAKRYVCPPIFSLGGGGGRLAPPPPPPGSTPLFVMCSCNLLQIKSQNENFSLEKWNKIELNWTHCSQVRCFFFIGSVYNHTRVSLPSSHTHVVASETRGFGYSHTSDDWLYRVKGVQPYFLVKTLSIAWRKSCLPTN